MGFERGALATVYSTVGRLSETIRIPVFTSSSEQVHSAFLNLKKVTFFKSCLSHVFSRTLTDI